MLRVGCDRVGAAVRGGSSGESGVLLCGRAICDVGVVGDSVRVETSAWSQGLQGDAEKRRRCGAWNVARF